MIILLWHYVQYATSNMSATGFLQPCKVQQAVIDKQRKVHKMIDVQRLLQIAYIEVLWRVFISCADCHAENEMKSFLPTF